MQKLDRLGWMAGISVYAYGMRIGIRTNCPAIAERLPEFLPPGWEPGLSPLVDHLYSLRVGGPGASQRSRIYHWLYGGPTRLARTRVIEDVLETLAGDLELYVAMHARNRLFIHAGVVGWRGRAIVLPGRTWSGKSTLVAALLRAGATYYSDDMAVLDGRGLVHAFARPLSLRDYDPQQRSVQVRRCGPEEFGSGVGHAPLPVGLIALTRHDPDGRWRPRILTPAKAVLELMEFVMSADGEPDMILNALQPMVQHARALKGIRGEANETAAALLAAIEEMAEATPVLAA
jgi:hypothetical protein